MNEQLKKNRAGRVYAHLRNETPIDLSSFRFGDFADLDDGNPAGNYQVLVLTNNHYGFSSNMIMRWISSIEPDFGRYGAVYQEPAG